MMKTLSGLRSVIREAVDSLSQVLTDDILTSMKKLDVAQLRRLVEAAVESEYGDATPDVAGGLERVVDEAGRHLIDDVMESVIDSDWLDRSTQKIQARVNWEIADNARRLKVNVTQLEVQQAAEDAEADMALYNGILDLVGQYIDTVVDRVSGKTSE